MKVDTNFLEENLTMKVNFYNLPDHVSRVWLAWALQAAQHTGHESIQNAHPQWLLPVTQAGETRNKQQKLILKQYCYTN